MIDNGNHDCNCKICTHQSGRFFPTRISFPYVFILKIFIFFSKHNFGLSCLSISRMIDMRRLCGVSSFRIVLSSFLQSHIENHKLMSAFVNCSRQHGEVELVKTLSKYEEAISSHISVQNRDLYCYLLGQQILHLSLHTDKTRRFCLDSISIAMLYVLFAKTISKFDQRHINLYLALIVHIYSFCYTHVLCGCGRCGFPYSEYLYSR